MNLGQTIKDRRKTIGINQTEFAKKCNITQTYLSQIESNDKSPTLMVLVSISENLKLPLPVLFFLTLDEQDIAENKKEAFEIIRPILKEMLSQFFKV